MRRDNANQYGSYCTPCSGCNGHGTCHGGVNGDGLCTCNPGYNGPFCQYSDAVTCNGHGTVNYLGQCLRQEPDGSWVSSCYTGYTGLTCNVCAQDHYNYPTCTYCTRAVTCNNRGTCDSSGQCVCDNPNIIGPNCDECVSGTYGPSCTPCPGGAANPCNGFGTCDSGMGGTGVCSCVLGRDGPACELSDAFECNDHGQVSFDGSCECDPGFVGPNCCPPGWTGPGGCAVQIDPIFRDGFEPPPVAETAGPAHGRSP